ncbi:MULTISPECIES: D-glycero-beta-D-manno-heptose-7-phosphate kinase [Achromobacter]|uniref:D-beta-D-heptose 7-phosphate kinase n=2 Tax=Achromobacter piechaudii TaxID=72556 RepID=A0A6S7EFK9_9BURK|nr:MULTISPECIES: D-glycero-beta-D-manno-heptose-7-phosphate kinase [Achromobacter]EFF76479.1 bifunctional protein RfaE, domain I [Achromobacter piechaudii ATCC 43553]MPS79116.1 D-glycero-beta-D-manno-heptose-7-phosphate kinase [Achromobacter sp.]CAB3718881.1 D-beta-D-heptose 7-phosphate kinase [Achromobacter piechaudii]CAB3888097.1 D-beta-D-heptose 7-phosphate kinase [Achromobacter piechaudii]CAB3910620.1 D-beta-D-heptose 7-phosphate kinase [Achromobacter piechaudii]
MKPFPAEAISQSRVLVVGDVMLDRYWFGEVERISPEAPVPVVRVARREDRLGGAANVARNVAALGGQVTLVGVLGEDEAGDSIRKLSAEAGIRTELIADPSLHTTLKMRVLGRQQQLLRVDFEQHPEQAALDSVDAALARHLANHDVVVLSDYAKGVLARVESLVSLARDAGIPVLVDPKGDDYSRYRGATLVTPNRAEMQQAVGRWNSEAELTERAQRLRADLDLEALLVTRSEQGMTLFTDAGRDHIDAQAHEVFDVSGAGDTVLATLAVSRAIGLPWAEAMGWANKAGGIAVGKLGTSVVTAAELAGEIS